MSPVETRPDRASERGGGAPGVNDDRERLRAVDLAVGQIEKQFGKGSIMRLSLIHI